ncbi:MAG: TetR/AcrR family transcriptional regulator [Deltaproteobacteria bacterium]
MSLMTKRELAGSLKKLMGKKPLAKITVKDLVTDCGVNRQTFYYHFRDIYNLLGWVYKTEALEVLNRYQTHETWQQGFLHVFNYILANQAFCMNSLNSLGRDYLLTFLYKIIFDSTMVVINDIAKNYDASEEDKEFIGNFYTYAFVALVIEWMKKGMKEKPEDIIDRLSKLMEGNVGRALERYEQK